MYWTIRQIEKLAAAAIRKLRGQAEGAWVRRQRVQTRARTTRPPIRTLPICRLGRNRRFVRTLEWLTLWPYCGRFPHISHFFAMSGRSGLRTEPDCTIGPAHDPGDTHGLIALGLRQRTDRGLSGGSRGDSRSRGDRMLRDHG